MAEPEEQFDELHWEIIDILREGRVTPSYLGERTGESRQLVSQRLRDLQLSGMVEKVHKGLYELDEDPDSPEQDHDVQTDTPSGAALAAVEGDDLEARMQEALSSLDIPGRPAEVEQARRDAIMYAWRRLRHEGQMKPRVIANDTFGEFFNVPELGYSTAGGDRYAGYQLWDNCLRNALRELPGVAQSGRTWVFQEEVDE